MFKAISQNVIYILRNKKVVVDLIMYRLLH